MSLKFRDAFSETLFTDLNIYIFIMQAELSSFLFSCIYLDYLHALIVDTVELPMSFKIHL